MDESALRERLRAGGLEAASWSNGPGDVYAAHDHAYDKVLVCVRGGITFHLGGIGRDVVLDPGDRLDLPAATGHAATVGSAGVTCLEAHLPAGTLDGMVRHRQGSW